MISDLLIHAVYLVRWAWGNDLNRFELGFLLLAVVFAAAVTGKRGRIPQVEWGRHRTTAVLATGGLALFVRLALLPWNPVPQPGVTDEFSHLLLADTLLHKRLANPPIPLRAHFETIHVLPFPAYASMYFPGQGMVLAAGKALTGFAWAGVLVSVALCCASICWMLQAWLPAGWALLGGLFAVLRFAAFSYWVDSYWGGAVPAIAGALVLGAAGRMRHKQTLRNGLTMGLGMGLLLISRPYEGAALCLPVTIWMIGRWRGLAPAAAMAALFAGGLGYYSFRVTGRVGVLPYQVNQEVYGWPMSLAWYRPKPVSISHKELREYHDWELGEHNKLIGLHGWPDVFEQKFQFLWSFFLGPTLSLPLLFLLSRTFRDRRVRLLFWVCGAELVALGLEQSAYPHYAAPATAALFGIVLQSIRHLRQWKWHGKPAGRTLVALLPLVLVCTLALRLFRDPLRLHLTTEARYLSWCCSEPGNLERAAVLQSLERTGGRHLVVVHYSAGHNFSREWVYNGADLANSKVIWARDMGAANEELLRYYPDREAWMVRTESETAEPDIFRIR